MEGKSRASKKKYGLIAACAVLVLAVVLGAYWLGRSAGGGADVGEEAAKLAALGHARVSEADLTQYGISRDERSGGPVYEVEFTADGVEYDYEVSAADGSIVKFQKELDGAAPPVETPPVTDPTAQPTAGDIGEERAWAVAYDHAGVAAAEATASPAKMDYDNGVLVYELEFFSGGYEYDYEVSAADGSVVKFEKEWGVSTSPIQTPSSGASAGTTAQLPAGQIPAAPDGTGDIGEARAKEIALGHAGVSADSATGYRCERDYDDGVLVYELEFLAGGYEYDYEVKAADGSVLKSEKELSDRTRAPQTSAAQDPVVDTAPAYIGEARAREIAYAYAGVSAGDVLHCDVELDHHDDGHHSGHGTHHAAGCCAYKIDFRCGGYEYDYEVDAVTGELRKAQREVDD